MKLDIVGLNLIVMKEEIHVDDQHGLEIYPEMKKNEDTGKYEVVLAQFIYKNFAVKIYDRDATVFQIQSDVAKTMYKYYFNGQA